MGAATGNELGEMNAQLISRVGRNMVELIHGDQPVIERFHTEPVHGEAECRVGAYQHLVLAFQKRLDGIDLAAIVRTRRVAFMDGGV